MAADSEAPAQRAGPLALTPSLRVGDAVVEGWHLLRVEKRAGARWALRIGPPELSVIVERKRADCEYLAESAHFGLWLEPPGQAPPGLVAALAERLREPSDPIRLLDAAPPHELASEPTLHLVPGHIGEPFDLSVRAVHVLSSVSLVLVEAGSLPAAARTLALLGIDGVTTEEFDREALRTALADGHDVALFGCDEGIPGFCDPGKELLAGLEARVRSVGGPSVLGTALMRVPFEVRDFVFLGLLETRGDAARIRRRSGGVGPVPVVCFATGRALRAHVRGVTRRRRGAVHVVGNLTRSDEYALAFAMGVPQLPERIADDDRLVVFLAFESPAKRLRNWFAAR